MIHLVHRDVKVPPMGQDATTYYTRSACGRERVQCASEEWASEVECGHCKRIRAHWKRVAEPEPPIELTDQAKELNAWRELGEEIGRVISLMPAETFADWFPDWFGPRLFDLQVGKASVPLSPEGPSLLSVADFIETCQRSPEEQEQKQLDQSFAELMSAKPDVEDVSPTQAPLKELIERRLELSEELRNGLAGVIAKQDEELKLLRAKVSALSPHPPTSDVFPAVKEALDLHCRGFMDRPTTRENIAALVEKVCETYDREVQHRQTLQHQLDDALKGSPQPPTSGDDLSVAFKNGYERGFEEAARAWTSEPQSSPHPPSEGK